MTLARLVGSVCLVLGLAGQASWAATATRAVVLTEIAPLVVDAKSATSQGWLTLRNGSDSAQVVRLSIGDFISATTGRALGTQAEFFDGAATTGVHSFERKLNPNETVAVRLLVKNLWEAGESSASLLVNDDAHPLKAIATNVPFDVTLAAGSADKPTMAFEYGRRRQMILKNDDAMTYPLAWKLFLPDEGAVLEGTTTLPAKSTVPIALDPPREWFRHSFEGLFKDDVRPALLSVRFAPAASTITTALPTRTVNVELRLAYWSDAWRSGLGNLIILSILVAGGMCSLVLGMSIPNRLTRIELSRRLDAIAQDIRVVSSQVPSILRVALRVERLRLVEAVRNQRAFGADTADQLKKFEREIEALGRRVQLAGRLDEVVAQLSVLQHATSAAPPSRIDDAVRAVEKASGLLAKTAAGEAEVQAAEVTVQGAATQVSGIMREDADFAKALAERIKGLRSDFGKYSVNINMEKIYKEMKKELADLFVVLEDATYEDAANIPVGKYHWIDTSVEKLFVLRHYMLRYQDSEPDEKRHKRIADVREELVKLLRLQTWNTLQLARSLRRQCEQDIFASDVEAELKNGRARVECEPLNVYPNLPARLRVRFTDPRFDECDARCAIRCGWNFGTKVGKEEGWDIVHYFRNKDEANVEVEFDNFHGGSDDKTFLTHTVPLQEGQQKDWWSDRAKAETGRLLLALSVAVLALLAGAREQLLKLDLIFGLIAVFLLGVGADAIKNLFAKRT